MELPKCKKSALLKALPMRAHDRKLKLEPRAAHCKMETMRPHGADLSPSMRNAEKTDKELPRRAYVRKLNAEPTSINESTLMDDPDR
jgi:hypothetical protein